MPAANDELVRVMSFNIWRSGGRSLPNTIEAIRRAAPDVVGLQECTRDVALTIARELKLALAHDERSNAILSRHPIADSFATQEIWGGAGAVIELLDTHRRIAVFDAHLHWDCYGPYYLKQGKDPSFVVEEERRMRMTGLNELLDLAAPFIQDGDPTFVVGDFNAPSHLDYGGDEMLLRWPTSVACYERGLIDSYGVLHPMTKAPPFAFDDPGITWSPLIEEEPHGAFDRIDFIYFANATPTSASPIDQRNGVDPWPSDHRAVLSTFSLAASASASASS